MARYPRGFKKTAQFKLPVTRAQVLMAQEFTAWPIANDAAGPIEVDRDFLNQRETYYLSWPKYNRATTRIMVVFEHQQGLDEAEALEGLTDLWLTVHGDPGAAYPLRSLRPLWAAKVL